MKKNRCFICGKIINNKTSNKVDDGYMCSNCYFDHIISKKGIKTAYV